MKTILLAVLAAAMSVAAGVAAQSQRQGHDDAAADWAFTTTVTREAANVMTH